MDLIWGQSSDEGGLLTTLIKDFMHHQYVWAIGERLTGRKARGLQMEEIGCKCQTFLISLKRQGETN